MGYFPPLPSIAPVAACLPFHLDAFDRVNETFERWRRDDDPDAGYLIDLWTYCFIRRYLLLRFMQNARYGSDADLDGLVEQVYVRVRERRLDLPADARYAHWVSVVARRTLLNYLRRLPVHVPLDADYRLADSAALPDTTHDLALATTALYDAIEDLPDYLRDVARLRFFHDCAYDELADLVGKPTATVRSYVHRALLRLREDPRLAPFVDPSQQEIAP